MRFAYIDSNGNEVPIPSVDALALRIELGAINENTELYDAQADQWGAAHTHEIFHTLSRTAGGEEGFVAPPPAAPVPKEEIEPEGEPEVAEEPAPEVEEEAPLESGDLGLTLAEAEEPPADTEEAPAETSGAGDQGLTLAKEPDEESGSGDDVEAGAGELDIDLGSPPGPTDSEGVSTPMDLTPAGSDTETSGEIPGMTGGFDFGDMSGGLELESTMDGPEESPAMDFSGDGGTPDFSGGEAAPDFSGGMELETSMDIGAGGVDAGAGGSLDLEAPMSEFSPADPPAWMEGGASDTNDGDDVMDFSAVGSESDGEGASDDVPLRDRRTPRNKPSAPKHRRERSLAGPIAAAVILLVIGVGGYVTWPVLNNLLSGSGQPDIPSVVIPDIPAELMPQMRELAQSALGEAFADVRRGWGVSHSVMAPSTDWLSGAYLANASQFNNVEVFWHGMEDFLEGLQAVDLATFDVAYGVQLEAEAVSASDAGVMRERADSGFVAAAVARDETYARVQALIDAALQLHAFLIANESNIAYVPALTATTDPVLEASPSTPEIRAAMEDMIDDVTDALAALDYRGVVTADELWAKVLSTVQERGLR